MTPLSLAMPEMPQKSTRKLVFIGNFKIFSAIFHKCDEIIPWNKLSEPLKDIIYTVENERRSVWANSAYMDKARKAKQQERSVFCDIIEKTVCSQKALTQTGMWDHHLAAGINAVVEHLFAWMKDTGYGWTR